MSTPTKLERVPPEKKMSDSVKFEDGSERVKESIAVSPALSDATSVLRVMVGGVQSLVVETEACVAELPAKSVTSAVILRVPSLREERSRFAME